MNGAENLASLLHYMQDRYRVWLFLGKGFQVFTRDLLEYEVERVVFSVVVQK